jgi:F-type H+-transporting ATPase subunit b
MNIIDIVHAETEAAAEGAHVAVEGGAASASPLASLGINPTLFVFQLINFAVVAAIIWFLILKPLTKKMTERQKMIDESLDNAKKIQDNLQKSEQKYQERIDNAKVEAGKVIEKAGKDAEQLSIDMKAKAKSEIESLVEQAKRNIRSERDEMVADVKKASAELIVAALEKILSEKIDDKKDKQLVEEMIKKLQ